MVAMVLMLVIGVSLFISFKVYPFIETIENDTREDCSVAIKQGIIMGICKERMNDNRSGYGFGCGANFTDCQCPDGSFVEI
jgi:hypothetical protein